MTIEDPWHWLRDPGYPEVKDPDVLAYLEAENAYFQANMSPHQGLIDAIFEEMKAPPAAGPFQRALEGRRLVLPVALRRRRPVPGLAALAGRRAGSSYPEY